MSVTQRHSEDPLGPCAVCLNDTQRDTKGQCVSNLTAHNDDMAVDPCCHRLKIY